MTQCRWAVVAMGCVLGVVARAEEKEEDELPRLQTVVTATRTEQRDSEATISTEVITAREIRASGARDLSELLETQPGVEIVRTFRGAGIRLQGLDSEYVLVLIDGERAGGRTGGTLDISRFSLQDVERVEIVKGPASVLYGSDAIGGVVNLITRRTRRPFEALGRASYGTRKERDVRLLSGVDREKVTLTLYGGYRGGDAYDLAPEDPSTSGSAHTDWDVGGTLALKLHPKLRVDLRLDYSRRDLAGVDSLPTGAVFDRRNRPETFDTAARVQWSPGEDTRFLLRFHHSHFRDQLLQDQRQSREQDQYQDSRERLYELGLQYDQRIVKRHLLSVGLDGLWEGLQSPRLTEGVGRRQRLGIYAQDDWHVFDAPKVSVTGGVRLDLDTQFGTRPSPRIGLRVDPVERWTLRASYGWGFRAPSFTEQFLRFENPAVGYVVDGNPALLPEQSQGLNLSTDVHVSDGLTLSASAFLTDIQDLITVVTLREATAETLTQFGYENVARARTQGVEASVRAKLYDGLWLDLGYVLTDPKNRDTGELLEGRAVHRGTVALSYRYRRWGLEASARSALVGPRLFRPDVDGDGVVDAVWAKPYADLDARLAKDLGENATVYAVGQNLFGAGDALYLPLPPRSFFVGLEARY